MSSVSATESPTGTWGSGLSGYFKLDERGTSVTRELRGGLATFFTMAYIIVLNPIILAAGTAGVGQKHLSFDQLTACTALVAAVMTFIMGVGGNLPLAIAAGLGLDTVVAVQIAPTMSWPDAMGLVVIEGLGICFLVITGLRRVIMDAIPLALKQAISVGIGLFIAFIGLVDSGIVTRIPDAAQTTVPVQLGGGGTLVQWPSVVFVVGLLLAIVLLTRRVPGAILLSIVAATVLAVIIEAIATIPAPGGFSQWGLTIPKW